MQVDEILCRTIILLCFLYTKLVATKSTSNVLLTNNIVQLSWCDFCKSVKSRRAGRLARSFRLRILNLRNPSSLFWSHRDFRTLVLSPTAPSLGSSRCQIRPSCRIFAAQLQTQLELLELHRVKFSTYNIGSFFFLKIS